MRASVLILSAILILCYSHAYAGTFTFDVNVSPDNPPRLVISGISIDDKNSSSMVKPMENVAVTVSVSILGGGDLSLII